MKTINTLKSLNISLEDLYNPTIEKLRFHYLTSRIRLMLC
jgi:hypothetical protein